MACIHFLRTLKSLALYLLIVLPVLFIHTNVSGQDVNTRLDSLENRLRRLEIRFDTARARILSAFGAPRSFTRNELESGNFGSRIKLTTQKSVLEIGGFIQGDVIYNFKSPGKYLDAMVPSTIPVPNSTDPTLFMGIRQTRFTTRSTTQTALGELRTQFEFDLFAANNQTTFHIRHAWGKLGRLGVGQYWTNFMDIDVFPNIFEYWGPNSMPFVRQPQVRYEVLSNDHLKIHISAEAPGSQIQINDSARFSGRTTYPDGVAAATYTWGGSHIKLAGLVHPISYRDNGVKKTETGYGFNLSGNIVTNAKNFITAEITYGNGIGKYFDDLGVQNYDAVQNNAGNLKPLPAFGGFFFYNFWLSDRFSSSLGYSYLKANTFSSQAGNDYKSGKYGVANITYYPVDYVKMGIEYQYGRRDNIDGGHGDNSRIQFSANYKF